MFKSILKGERDMFWNLRRRFNSQADHPYRKLRCISGF